MPSGPDFIGVGFEGAGAEWFFDRLLAHPDVEPPHDGEDSPPITRPAPSEATS